MKKSSLFLFFLLAYGITWGASWLNTSLDTVPALTILGTILILLGPALAAMIAAFFEQGRNGIHNLLKPIKKWNVGIGWWIFVFAYPIAMHLTILAFNWMFTREAPRFFHAEGVPEGHPAVILIGLILVNLVRGFGEETGWRGFALPRLQTRWSAWTSSLVLGLVWALWHFHPANISILGKFPVLYVLIVIPATIIFTWLYNNTDGSLLIAIVFHMMLDVAEYIVPLGLYEGDIIKLTINAIMNWIMAILLITLFGWKYLSRTLPDFLKEP
jgi:membrane protease YdiL (CAAX protease family)